MTVLNAQPSNHKAAFAALNVQHEHHLCQITAGLSQNNDNKTALTPGNSEPYADIQHYKHFTWLQDMADFLRHELRDAMSGIQSSLDLLKNQNSDLRASEYLARAQHSVTYMRRLLNDTIEASNLEASFHSETHESVNLAAIVQEVVEDYRLIFSDHTFLIEGDTSPTLIRANSYRIREMLGNIIRNAIQHGNSALPIQVSLQKRNEWGILSVIDEGDALPADKTTIFGWRISRRHSMLKTDDSSGLGLYIVKLIVEAYGGKVEAQDLEERQGARFVIILPLMEQ